MTTTQDTTVTLTSGEQVTGQVIGQGKLILTIKVDGKTRAIFLHDIAN